MLRGQLRAAAAGRVKVPLMVPSVVKSTDIFNSPEGWLIAPSQCPLSSFSCAHIEVAHSMPNSKQDRPIITNLFMCNAFYSKVLLRHIDVLCALTVSSPNTNRILIGSDEVTARVES